MTKETFLAIKNLSSAELQTKLQELKRQFFDLRIKHSTSQLENTGQIREIKKSIARIKTAINQQTTN